MLVFKHVKTNTHFRDKNQCGLGFYAIGNVLYHSQYEKNIYLLEEESGVNIYNDVLHPSRLLTSLSYRTSHEIPFLCFLNLVTNPTSYMQDTSL